jgi:Na+/pantothenate symporter
MVSCLVLLVLCAYAGLAIIFRWRGWRPVAAAVAWLTIALGAFCVWIWLAGRIAGFSPIVPVVLFAIAGFVLWAVRREPDLA